MTTEVIIKGHNFYEEVIDALPISKPIKKSLDCRKCENFNVEYMNVLKCNFSNEYLEVDWKEVKPIPSKNCNYIPKIHINTH